MIYGTFENCGADRWPSGCRPAAFALACVLLFGYLCAFAVSLLRHANFHVRRRKNLLEVRAGAADQAQLPDCGGQDWVSGHPAVAADLSAGGLPPSFCRRWGYGKFRDDVSALIPCVRKKQLERSLRLLLPEYRILPAKGGSPTGCGRRFDTSGGRRRCWFWCCCCGGILILLFPGWVELIQWVRLYGERAADLAFDRQGDRSIYSGGCPMRTGATRCGTRRGFRCTRW